MRIAFVILILKIILFYNVDCQINVQEEWIRFYTNSDSASVSNDIKIDNSGNVYVTGYSVGDGYYNDITTIKYNTNGVLKWKAKYDGPNNHDNDEGIKLVLSDSGDVYVTGTSRGTTAWEDMVLIKYDSSGVERWVRRYTAAGSNGNEPSDIAVDNFGNVYITGYSTFTDSTHYFTIKYSHAGNLDWVKTYTTPGNNFSRANAMAIDRHRNIYVTGGSGILSGNMYSFYEFLTIKYNSNGDQIWITRYQPYISEWAEANDIVVDPDGSVYVTGSSYDTSSSLDYATIKYDVNGTQIWVSHYDGPGIHFDIPIKIAIDNSGYVYVTGYSDGLGSTWYDYATIKYNNDGIEQWVSRYNGAGNGWDYSNALALDKYGNVYVSGWSVESTSSEDFTTIKYNSNGLEEWNIQFNGNNNLGDLAKSMTIDSSGNIYVTGISYVPPTRGIGTIIKYSQNTTSALNNQLSYNCGIYLSENYPNPFNPITNIMFMLPRPEKVKIEVFNILGQSIEILQNKYMLAGSHEIEFNAEGLPNGIYLYRIQAGGFQEVKKMILLR